MMGFSLSKNMSFKKVPKRKHPSDVMMRCEKRQGNYSSTCSVGVFIMCYNSPLLFWSHCNKGPLDPIKLFLRILKINNWWFGLVVWDSRDTPK